MRRRIRRDDRGSFTIWTAIFAVSILLLVGLVVDGGQQLRIARRADAIAQEAARAGAQAASRPSVNGQPVLVVDQAAAVRAANNYLAAAGESGRARSRGTRSIEVTVTVQAQTGILCLIGVCSVSSTGTATAELVFGTSREE